MFKAIVEDVVRKQVGQVENTREQCAGKWLQAQREQREIHQHQQGGGGRPLQLTLEPRRARVYLSIFLPNSGQQKPSGIFPAAHPSLQGTELNVTGAEVTPAALSTQGALLRLSAAPRTLGPGSAAGPVVTGGWLGYRMCPQSRDSPGNPVLSTLGTGLWGCIRVAVA